MDFTLAELEANEKFKTLSVKDQRKLRESFFASYVLPTEDFAAFSTPDKNKVFDAITNRDPVFENPDAPEVRETQQLIEATALGDWQSKMTLMTKPYLNSLAKTTLTGTALTWTIDKLNDLIDPDNQNSQLKFTLGKESEKLAEYTKRRLPDLVPNYKVADIVGAVAGFAEIVGVAYATGGTALVAKGFAKPIAKTLGAKALTMPSGLAQRALSSTYMEIANAVGSGLGFAIVETLQTMMKREDPLQVSEVAKNFGANVAFDYALWTLGGVLKRLGKFAKLVYASGDIAQSAQKELFSNVLSGDKTAIYKQLDSIDPQLASRLKNFEIEKIRPTDDAASRMKFLANSLDFDVNVVEHRVSKDVTSKMYEFVDADGKVYTEPLPYQEALDFLAKAQPSSLDIVPMGQKWLNRVSTYEFDLSAASHEKDVRNILHRRIYSDDPGFIKLQAEWIVKAENLVDLNGQPAQVRKVKNLFDTGSFAVAESAPEGIYEFGIGKQIQRADGTLDTVFPAFGNASGKSDSPALAAWKERLAINIKAGIIEIPESFKSIEQKTLFMRQLESNLADIIAEKHKLSGDALRDYLVNYDIRLGKKPKLRTVFSPTTVQLTEGLNSQTVNESMASTRDLVSLAWGDLTPRREVLKNAVAESFQAIDGSLHYYVQKRPVGKDTKWLSILNDAGEKLEFESLQDLRIAAIKKMLAENRLPSASLQQMVAMSSGYRLVLAGQPIVEKEAAVAPAHMLILMNPPAVKAKSGLSYQVIESAPTLDGLFAKKPELWDIVADAPTRVSKTRLLWTDTNPYIEVSGRVFAGADNDIVDRLMTGDSRKLKQEIMRYLGLGFDDLGVSSERVWPQGRPRLVMSKIADAFYLTPSAGGRTLSFGGKDLFESAESLKAYMSSNMAIFRNLQHYANQLGLAVDILPNGSITMYNAAGEKTIFRDRQQLNQFFNKDIFKNLDGFYQNEYAEAANEILGAHKEYRQLVSADLEARKAMPQVSTFKAKTEQMFKVDILDGAKRQSVDLYKPQRFGWELNLKLGNGNKDTLLKALEPFGLKPIFESDGIVRIQVGGRDLARSVTDAIDGIVGTQRGILDEGYEMFSDRVSARFLPKSPVDPKDYSVAYRTFFSGDPNMLNEYRAAKRPIENLRYQMRRIEAFAEMHLGPVEETAETLVRLGVPGSRDFKKMLFEFNSLKRLMQIDSNQLQPKINAMLKNIDFGESTFLSKLMFIDEARWDLAAKHLDKPALTQAQRDVLRQSKTFLDDLFKQYGISANGLGDMSQMKEVSDMVNKLAAEFSGREISQVSITDLANKLKNAENLPMLINVWSDSMRPEELFMMLQGSDLKTFLQVTTESVLKRRYLAEMREPAMKLFIDVSRAKAENLPGWFKGVDKFMFDTMDQWLGKRTASEELAEGLLKPLSENIFKNSQSSPVLMKTGFPDAFRSSDIYAKISNMMTFTTQGGRIFNPIRNATQVLYQASVVPPTYIFRASEFVLDNPKYIDDLISRARISQGFIERVESETARARFMNAWLQPMGNSEIVNRATTIKAAEMVFDDYLPRLRSGLESEASFIKAIGASVLYNDEQTLLMHLVKSGELDAAKDFLGTIWQRIVHFDYGPASMGLAFRGATGKSFGKFLTQNVSTVAYMWRTMRTQINPLAALATGAKFVAIMETIRRSFEAVGIQYDGFKWSNQFDIAGGPAFQLATDLLKATRGGPQGEASLKSASRIASGTLVPFMAQANMLKKAESFYAAGRYWDCVLALTGAPIRTEDQLEWLDMTTYKPQTLGQLKRQSKKALGL